MLVRLEKRERTEVVNMVKLGSYNFELLFHQRKNGLSR